MYNTTSAPSPQKQKQKSKVVVRNLPPTLSEDEFKNVIKDFLPMIDWLDYWRGKKSAQKQIPSRAFLHFTDQEALYKFAETFDKHVFMDSKGNPVVCSVEYAQYQHYGHTLNDGKTKPDPRVNTIEQDEHYIKFMQDLKNPPPPPKEEPTPPPPNVYDMSTPLSTPILDELRRKAALKLQLKNQQRLKLEQKRKRAGPDSSQRSSSGQIYRKRV